MTIDQIREIVISPDAIMRKEWGKVLLYEIDRLNAKLEEGKKYRKFFESCLCCFAEGEEFFSKTEIYEAIKRDVKKLEASS